MTKTNEKQLFSLALYSLFFVLTFRKFNVSYSYFSCLFVCLFLLARWLFTLEGNYLTKLVHWLNNIVKKIGSLL